MPVNSPARQDSIASNAVQDSNRTCNSVTDVVLHNKQVDDRSIIYLVYFVHDASRYGGTSGIALSF
jgi:hypothetical protein